MPHEGVVNDDIWGIRDILFKGMFSLGASGLHSLIRAVQRGMSVPMYSAMWASPIMPRDAMMEASLVFVLTKTPFLISRESVSPIFCPCPFLNMMRSPPLY